MLDEFDTYLQFFEMAALALSEESPSKHMRFMISFGPLSSVTEGAPLDIIRFFPLVQSTSNYIYHITRKYKQVRIKLSRNQLNFSTERATKISSRTLQIYNVILVA